MITSCHTDGRVESVLVLGGDQPLEGSQRRPPEGIVEVIASTVERPVLGVEAHIAPAVDLRSK